MPKTAPRRLCAAALFSFFAPAPPHRATLSQTPYLQRSPVRGFSSPTFATGVAPPCDWSRLSLRLESPVFATGVASPRDWGRLSSRLESPSFSTGVVMIPGLACGSFAQSGGEARVRRKRDNGAKDLKIHLFFRQSFLSALFARIAKKSKSYAHRRKEICYNARIMAGVRKTGLAEKVAAIPWNFSIPHSFLRASLSILPPSPLRIKQIIHGASYRT